MDFALVFFDEDKRYAAVAVASFKGKSVLEKGASVTVLGSSFDPVANKQIDEEWAATIIALGSEREMKREVPQYNEKARKFEESKLLAEPRKRKPNKKYAESGADMSEEEINPPEKKRKPTGKHAPPKKSIAKVQVHDTDSESEPQSWSPERETEELLGKFARKVAENKKKAKRRLQGAHATTSCQKPKDDEPDYKSRCRELQLQLDLQHELRKRQDTEEREERERLREQRMREEEMKEKQEQKRKRNERERQEKVFKKLEKEKELERKRKEERRQRELNERQECERKERDALEERENRERQRNEKERQKRKELEKGKEEDMEEESNEPSSKTLEEDDDEFPDWMSELADIQSCRGCSFLARQLAETQKELKALKKKLHKNKLQLRKPAGATSNAENEKELMHKEKVSKDDCVTAIKCTSKWGQSIRELMDLLFTSYELANCSVKGRGDRAPLPKKRWNLLITVIMEKFKDIRETTVVQIANVKLQEHRRSTQD